MNNKGDSRILAALALILLSIAFALIKKEEEDTTFKGKARKARRELERKAKQFKNDVYKKYDAAMDHAEDLLVEAQKNMMR